MRPNGITSQAMTEITLFLGVLMDSIKAVPKGATEKQAKEAVVEFINAALAKVSF